MRQKQPNDTASQGAEHAGRSAQRGRACGAPTGHATVRRGTRGERQRASLTAGPAHALRLWADGRARPRQSGARWQCHVIGNGQTSTLLRWRLTLRRACTPQAARGAACVALVRPVRAPAASAPRARAAAHHRRETRGTHAHANYAALCSARFSVRRARSDAATADAILPIPKCNLAQHRTPHLRLTCASLRSLLGRLAQLRLPNLNLLVRRRPAIALFEHDA